MSIMLGRAVPSMVVAVLSASTIAGTPATTPLPLAQMLPVQLIADVAYDGPPQPWTGDTSSGVNLPPDPSGNTTDDSGPPPSWTGDTSSGANLPPDPSGNTTSDPGPGQDYWTGDTSSDPNLPPDPSGNTTSDPGPGQDYWTGDTSSDPNLPPDPSGNGTDTGNLDPIYGDTDLGDDAFNPFGSLMSGLFSNPFSLFLLPFIFPLMLFMAPMMLFGGLSGAGGMFSLSAIDPLNPLDVDAVSGDGSFVPDLLNVGDVLNASPDGAIADLGAALPDILPTF